MRDIAHAHVDEVVSSWWGWGSAEDERLPEVLRVAHRYGLTVAVHASTPAAGPAFRRVVRRVERRLERDPAVTTVSATLAQNRRTAVIRDTSRFG